MLEEDEEVEMLQIDLTKRAQKPEGLEKPWSGLNPVQEKKVEIEFN